MSPEVIIAVVTAICTALPLILAQIVALVKVMRRIDRSDKDVEEHIETVKKASKVSKEYIDMIATGSYRMGHVDGVRYVTSHSKPADLE